MVAVAVFLTTIALASDSGTLDAAQDVPIPGCGVCATYSFLRCLKRPATLAELSAQFRADKMGFDAQAVSIEQIQNVLLRQRLPTDASRFSPGSLARLPTPCILYFRPGRWPRGAAQSTGHFVTLVKFVENRGVILDWSGVTLEPAVHVPISVIEQHWDGEAIVMHQDRDVGWRLVGVVLLIGGLAGVLLLRGRRLIGNRHLAVWMLLCAGMQGCGGPVPAESDETPEPTLLFSEPIARLGVLSPATLSRHEFEFQVWDAGAVTILGVDASCGCTVPDSSLFNRELTAGSVHKLKVTVRADGEASASTKTLRIRTDPESTAPLVLAIAYSRSDPPQLSVHELVADASPNLPATVKFAITYRHKAAQPSVSIDRGRSDFGDFELVDARAESNSVLLNPAMKESITVDTTAIELRAKERKPFGEHRNRLVLAFDDGTSQSLPTLIRVPHPVRLAVDRLFAGVLSPGQSVTKRTRMTCPREFGEPRVAFDGDGIFGVAVDGDELMVMVWGPTTPGRFSGRVLISFAAIELSPVTLNVEGIARDDGGK